MMAKKQDSDPIFEDEPEPEVEYTDADETAVDPDADLPDEVKKTSKKDLYARVKAAEDKAAGAADPTDRLTAAFEQVAGKLRPAETPQVQPAGESDADFMARLKKDLFDEEKAPDLLNELIDRRLGPRLAQVGDLTFRQAERIMELDPTTGPVYKRYATEVAAYIKTNFPANLQRDPRALEMAFKQVQVLHLDDIAQERANAILEAERKKGSATTTRRESLSLETEGGSAGSGSAAGPKKKVIQITQADRENADNMGVPAEVIARRRSESVS